MFFLFLASVSVAQNSTASPYSLGGLGDITFRGNAINRMMGGLNAYSDSIHANLNNPASLGDLKLTTFSVGLSYKNTELNAEDNTENVTAGAMDYISVSLPTKRFVFGFGVMPYSSVGYRLQSVTENAEDDITLDRFEGRGGVNKTFFTLGLRLFKGFNIGATANYNFGTISSEASQQRSTLDYGAYLSSQSRVTGFDFLLGSHIKIPLTKRFHVDLFGTYSPAHELISKNEQVYFTRRVSNQTFGAQQLVDLSESGLDKVTLSIGQKYEGGFSFGVDKKWMLGAQYAQIESENFRNDFIRLNNVSYENATRLSVGGFFIPNYASITSYLKRVAFRFGYRQELSGVVVNGTSLEETGISFGLSLPLGGFYSATNVSGYSNLNIGVELGERGVNTGGLIRERYWAIRLGLSLNDLWFVKRIYN